jgi:hypothetical protein
MDDRRRLAIDPPQQSAAATLGPHLLGRIYKPDPRDWTLEQLFQVLAPGDLPRGVDTTPGWELRIQLDQGPTSHCVGFCWAGWGNAAPVEDNFQNADGEPRAENGTTVRSGALALRDRARLAAFAFAKSTAEIDDWINTRGSVVIGSNWTNDMFNPDANGYVRPTGAVAGGHCYLMLERIDADDAYVFQNSWGAGWGLHGRFKMKRTDLEGLLRDQGDACCSTELPL